MYKNKNDIGVNMNTKEELEISFEEFMEEFRLTLEKTSGKNIDMCELDDVREQLKKNYIRFHSL